MFCFLRFQIFKYCQIITDHTSIKKLSYSAFRSCINNDFEKLTYDWFCGPVSHNIKYYSHVHEFSFLTLVFCLHVLYVSLSGISRFQSLQDSMLSSLCWLWTKPNICGASRCVRTLYFVQLIICAALYPNAYFRMHICVSVLDSTKCCCQ